MITEIPLLQNVRVASPCSASWEAMEPVEGERVRFCEGCQKRVYNLSAMGQAEAEGLLRKHEGRLCVRYYRRTDGTVLTTDCPVGLKAARQMVFRRTDDSRSLRSTVALFALFCLGLAFASAHQREGEHTTGVVARTPIAIVKTVEDIPEKSPLVKAKPDDGYVMGGLTVPDAKFGELTLRQRKTEKTDCSEPTLTKRKGERHSQENSE